MKKSVKRNKFMRMPREFDATNFSTLDAMKDSCQVIENWAKENNMKEEDVDIDIHSNYKGDIVIEVHAWRTETDEETQQRLGKYEEELKFLEQQRYEGYLKLKKIYEGKK